MPLHQLSERIKRARPGIPLPVAPIVRGSPDPARRPTEEGHGRQTMPQPGSRGYAEVDPNSASPLRAGTLSTEFTIASERHLLNRLLELVDHRARREREIEDDHAAEVSSEQKQYHEVFQLLTSTYESEQDSLQQGHVTGRAAMEERWGREATTVDAEFHRVIAEIDSRHTEEAFAAQKERDEAGWLVASLLDEDTDDSPRAQLQALQSGTVASQAELEVALQSLSGWYRQAMEFLQRNRLLSDVAPPSPSTLPSDVTGLHQTCVEAMRSAEPLYQSLMSRVLPRVFGGVWPFAAYLAVSGLLFGVVRSFVDPSLLGLKLEATARDWQFIAAGTSAALGLVVMFFLHLAAGRRTLPDFEKLLQLAVDADTAYQRWTVVSKRELERHEDELAEMHKARMQKRDAALALADTRLRERRDSAAARRDVALQSANAHYPARLAEIERTRVCEVKEAEDRFAAAWQDTLLRREHDFRNLQAAYDQRVAESRQVYQQHWMDLIREWQATLSELGAEADSMWEAIRSVCPEWSHIADDPNATLSDRVCEQLSLGRIVADLDAIEQGLSADPRLKTARTRFDLPLLLPLLDKPSLVVRARGASRLDAIRVLQTSMLRYLTSLPPGKVRFTILDPVGLGANFASFMHLADIDEQLVTSRIWTEPTHIEKRLGDLTEHMETVLQTYLRNEYPTLDDYNREAGEVAEPYRLLVVANFPTNFTEIALRRLVSIAEGGVRCGVFVLLSVDESQDLPRGFSLSDLERHATVLRLPPSPPSSGERAGVKGDLELKSVRAAEAPPRPNLLPAWTGGERTRGISPFRLADPDLAQWPLAFDEPPPADGFGRIIKQAGELARAVRRVEVPFERVMPLDDAYWTSSSRAGLDIPIGRAGATKLQHLRLGKGTSQHVLIAGKTGSGKSSLLHALITNTALYYSPDEIEFYLIDFKKGVEFKTYATQRLPHARVIAIESDREFGVSVLQRLDGLLKERGELFRRAGVQDLPSYRDAVSSSLSGRRESPGSSPRKTFPDVMPRVLLVIDEFQEFFTEEDALSQSASLLLDRLIRQGRAFGIHVLLGSQTLAGAYSLARSTLGQIAVRIALQCSDADSHLILSDDNTAARLLSRPGEAIYNDANGLVEGNHPFQVVWLDDSQRETYLGWMHEWADEYAARFATLSPLALGGRGAGSEGANLTAPPVAPTAPRWPEPIVFEGNIAADPLTNPMWLDVVRTTFSHPLPHSALAAPHSPSVRRCWLGEAVSLTGPLELRFGPRDGGPVLAIGRDDEAALGMLSSSLMALAGQGADAAKFIVLDGSLPDSDASKTWRSLAQVLLSGERESPGSSLNATAADPKQNSAHSLPAEPGDLRPPLRTGCSFQVFSPREAATALQTVVDEMHARQDDLAPPTFVVVFDVTRFRDLKKAEDDYGGFGGFDKEKTVSAAALFAEIVKDGPAAQVFPLVWCDGYQTAQRWLGRELLNRFETRVLFAMNANDSSNLIDTPAASKLGPNRALLSRGDLGTVEKFRPYKAPSFESLEQRLAPQSSDWTDQAEDLQSPRENDEPAAEATPSPDIASSDESLHGDNAPTPNEEWSNIDDLHVT